MAMANILDSTIPESRGYERVGAGRKVKEILTSIVMGCELDPP